MSAGFTWLIITQFFSALADHASLWVGFYLLQQSGAPDWQLFLPKLFLIVFYVLLAPLAGSLADRYEKKQVMFAANALKLAGALAMLAAPAWLAFVLIGVGAAIYAPAKFGLVTEIVPAAQLVRANSWIEVTTIAAVVLGTVAGGVLSSQIPAGFVAMLASALGLEGRTPSVAQCAIAVLALLYLCSAALNQRVPRVPLSPAAQATLRGFVRANACLWRDPVARVALVTTMLFWAVAAGLQLLSLGWMRESLGADLRQTAFLQASCEMAIIVAALLAGRTVKLERATDVVVLAYPFGALLILLPLIDALIAATIAMTMLGLLAGFLVVPMNALLQHRGRQLLSAGESIAIQNFNECLGIIGTLALLSTATAHGAPSSWLLPLLGMATLVVAHLVRRSINARLATRGQPIPHELLFTRSAR